VTDRALRRRYASLSALLFVPTGLLLPVTALLMRTRGLSLDEIGLVAACMSVVVLVLELPTGGLADVVGRRPLLLAAGALEATAVVLVLVARSPAAFAGAWCVLGASRALGSGPLEAWYVDAAVAADPSADIEKGLAAGASALSLAVAAAGLSSAALVSVPTGDVDPLLVPVVVALVAGLAGMAAVAVVVREPHRHLGLRSLLAGARGAPAAVRGTLAVVRRSAPLASLASVEVLWGAGLTGVELLVGPRLGDLLGGEREAVAAYGVAIAAGWTLSAAGAAGTTRLTALLGSPARAGAALRVGQGLAALVMALAAGPTGLLVGYLAFYVVHGPSNAVHYGMVHRLTTAEHRTAMVSLNSLAARLGGVVGALGLGALARAAGIPVAWVGAALLLAAAAPLYRVAGRGRRVTGATSEGSGDAPWVVGRA
jgi:hypothetical protein